MDYPAVAFLRRDLAATLRDGRVFAVMAVSLAVFSVVMFASWPEGETSLTLLRIVSEERLMLFSGLLLGAACLLVPPFAVNNIAREYREDTLDLVRLTPVSPLGAILEKAVNAAGFFVLLIVATMPVLACVYFLVGVDVGYVLLLVALQLLFTLSLGAAGTFMGLVFKGTFRALLGTYIAVGMVNAVVAPSLVQGFAGGAAPGAALIAIPVVLLFSLVFFLACGTEAWRAIEGRHAKAPAGPTVKTREEVNLRRRSFPFYLIDPMRVKPPISDKANPFLVKEMRWGLMVRATTLARVFYASLFMYLLVGTTILFYPGMDDELFSVMPSWYLGQVLLPVLISPVLLATTFSQDRDTGNLDMLRLTLYRPVSILWGKYLAGMQALLPFVFASVASVMVLAPWGLPLRERDLLVTAGTVAVCAALTLAVSMLVSLMTRNTGASIALSFVLGLLLPHGWPALVGALMAVVDPYGIVTWDPFDFTLLGAFSEVLYFERALGLWGVNLAAYTLIAALVFVVSVGVFHKRYLVDA